MALKVAMVVPAVQVGLADPKERKRSLTARTSRDGLDTREETGAQEIRGTRVASASKEMCSTPPCLSRISPNS